MIVEVDGQRLEVPDDATPDEIGAIAGPPKAEGRTPAAGKWVQKIGEGMVPGYNRLVALGDAAMSTGGTFGERYQGSLRALQGQSNETRRQAPWTSGLVQGVAGAPTALMFPAATAAPGLAGRAAASALSAAPVGAVYAAGDAPADAGAGEQLARTGMGALGAGLIGGAVPVAGAAAAPVARKLQSVALEQGRKALSGIGTPLAARRPIPEAAVREALESGAIKPFGTVGGTASRLEASAERIGAEYGAILSELERQGVTGPNAVTLAQTIAQRSADAAKSSLGSVRPKMLSDAAAELPTKVSPVPFASKRLGLSQAEEIKRGLQQEARREYDKISRQYTTSGETKKELASIVREAIEDSVRDQASKAPAAAASFEPVKARLANTLEALKHAEEGAARAARRKPISLTSTIAGSAAGAATGSPTLGLLSAMGHGVADARLASTLASGANAGAKALGGTAAPAALATSVRAGLPMESDPILRMLLEAMTRRVRLAPVAAEEGQ